MWYCVITGKGQEPRELTTACKVRHRRADAEHIRPEKILMETNEKEDLYDENLESLNLGLSRPKLVSGSPAAMRTKHSGGKPRCRISFAIAASVSR